jgi:hypothetical protein
MSHPVLLLDEDVRVLLGEVLRQRGYDVIHVLEVDRGGKNDPEQLDYAVSQGRAERRAYGILERPHIRMMLSELIASGACENEEEAMERALKTFVTAVRP